MLRRGPKKRKAQEKRERALASNAEKRRFEAYEITQAGMEAIGVNSSPDREADFGGGGDFDGGGASSSWSDSGCSSDGGGGSCGD